jgi:hypothetical protein
MVHPSKQATAARMVSAFAGNLLGWDKSRQELETKEYLAYVKKNSFFYDKPLE